MALKSPIDARDAIYEALVQHRIHKIPEVIDLRMYATASRDQRSRGTCAPISGAIIQEIRRAMTDGVNCQLSPEFIYRHREYAAAAGMSGRDVFKILHELGVPSEADYPYGTSARPKRRTYRKARDNRIGAYARVMTVEGLKHAIYNYGPCYIALPCYNASNKFWSNKYGSVERYSTSVGHAVVVIGYNRRGFILQNSWGEEWNGDGCTILPFHYWKKVWECWVSMGDHPKESKWKRFKLYFSKKPNM